MYQIDRRFRKSKHEKLIQSGISEVSKAGLSS
jgi:hypothetical protein